MKVTKITWIGFLVTLSALSVSGKTVAHETNSTSKTKSQAIETRLSRIAKNLQERENKLVESSDTKPMNKPLIPQEVAGWLKGGGGGFANRRGGGGFLNNRGWRDGGGFFNRRY